MSEDKFEFQFEEDDNAEINEPGQINIQSEGNPFGEENVYYEAAEK